MRKIKNTNLFWPHILRVIHTTVNIQYVQYIQQTKQNKNPAQIIRTFLIFHDRRHSIGLQIHIRLYVVFGLVYMKYVAHICTLYEWIEAIYTTIACGITIAAYIFRHTYTNSYNAQLSLPPSILLSFKHIDKDIT